MLLNGVMINLVEAYTAFRLGEGEKPSMEYAYDGMEFGIENLPEFPAWEEGDDPITDNQKKYAYDLIDVVIPKYNRDDWKALVDKFSYRQGSLFIQYLKRLNNEPTKAQVATVKEYLSHPWQAYRQVIEEIDYKKADRQTLSDLIGKLKRMERENHPITKEQYRTICRLHKQATGGNKYSTAVTINGQLTKRCLAELDQESAKGLIKMYTEFIKADRNIERKMSSLEEDELKFQKLMEEVNNNRSEDEEKPYDGYKCSTIGGVQGYWVPEDPDEPDGNWINIDPDPTQESYDKIGVEIGLGQCRYIGMKDEEKRMAKREAMWK